MWRSSSTRESCAGQNTEGDSFICGGPFQVSQRLKENCTLSYCFEEATCWLPCLVQLQPIHREVIPPESCSDHLAAANTIRILVATDNHVGYAERDPVRGDDSFITFNEIMELAKERDVDMVFLGGDLFHDNKPSRKAMYQVMRSIRLNCLGEKPCELQVLGDQSIIFDDK
jgi:hypothetical protein